MESASLLSIIAAVVFHIVVTLPLAHVTATQFVYPRLQKDAHLREAPQWAVVLVVFVCMALAFALRGHVTVLASANASRPRYVHHPTHHAGHQSHHPTGHHYTY